MGLFHRKKKITETVKTADMKFAAIAYAPGGEVPYFEKADYYELHMLEHGKPKQKQMIFLPSGSTARHVEMLANMGVDTVISKGFGPHSLELLHRSGIETCLFDGGPNAALKSYLKKELEKA